MIDYAKNFIREFLDVGINDTDTTLTFADATVYPDPSAVGQYQLLIWNNTDYPNAIEDQDKEIVRVTAKSGNNITVTRGQEGTSAVAHNTASKQYAVAMILTAGNWNAIKQQVEDNVADISIVQGSLSSHIADTGNPHAVTKAQVGLGNVDNTSDANKPVSTLQQAALDLKQSLSQKNQPLGYAGVDAAGKISQSLLPAIAIVDTFVVNSQAAMLALSAETGDVAIRTDENKTYILQGTDPSVLGDWQEMLTPTDTVLSVNGQTGSVSLDTDDMPEGSTNLYFTNARAITALTGQNVSLFINDAGYIDGNGSANRAAFWTDADTIAYDDNFVWDNTNKRLGIGQTTPTARLHVKGSADTHATIAIYATNNSGDVLFDLRNDGAVKIGKGAGILDTTGGNTNIYIGQDAGHDIIAGIKNIIIGSNAGTVLQSGSGYNVIIGADAKSGGGTGLASQNLVLLGYQAGFAQNGATNNISIGASSTPSITTGDFNIHIGANTNGTSNAQGQIAIGQSATTTKDNQLVIGGDHSVAFLSEGYFGRGVVSATANNFVLQITGRSGTNLNGNTFTIAGSKGTGLGTPGSIVFATSDITGSGTTLQALSEKMRLTGTGALGIGNPTPDTSALLELNSTTRGFLPPRMTSAERNAISAPATGLIVFDTTAGYQYQYDGTSWRPLGFSDVTAFTMDFIDALNGEFYSPYDMVIHTVTDIVNSPTTTISVNGSPYTLGNSISIGDLIEVSVDTNAVVRLDALISS